MNANAKDFPRLVGDIGGTNNRWAWQAASGAAIHRVRVYAGSQFPTIVDAMRQYLSDEALPVPAACAIGIASPVTGDAVSMINHPWSFSIEAVRRDLGFGRFVVVNDFTALALALPGLQASELRQVGGPAGCTPGLTGVPVALIGPGTGLGVSGLVPTATGSWIPLSGEGGHATLASTTPREAAVVEYLRQRFGHASAERAVSGLGLLNLYVALCTLDGVAPESLPASSITSRALDGSDPICREALALFCAFLGTMAGNLALTLGATGGVYIGGGIVPRLVGFFEQSAFRTRFESKGRYAPLLASIPVWVIDAAVSPALAGAARALDQP